MSKIVVLVKPWSIHHSEDILDEFDKLGERINSVKIDNLPDGLIARHYADHKNQPYYTDMTQDFTGQSIVVALYEGDRAKFDQLKDHLRERYAHEINPHPNPSVERSALHTSITEEEFLQEFAVWKAYLQ